MPSLLKHTSVIHLSNQSKEKAIGKHLPFNDPRGMFNLVGFVRDLKYRYKWEGDLVLEYMPEHKHRLIKNRDYITLFDNENIRQQVFKYYNKSYQHLSILQNSQQQKYNIESKLNEIIRDVKLKDGRLGHKKAVEIAVSLMPSEEKNLQLINESLPVNIIKVKDLKVEAKEILTNLSQLKL